MVSEQVGLSDQVVESVWCDGCILLCNSDIIVISHPSVGMMLYTTSCRLSALEVWRQVEELALRFVKSFGVCSDT